MNKCNLQQLEMFFRGQTSKVRLIIYLLATGKYDFDVLKNITVLELKSLCQVIPIDMLELIEICNSLIAHKNDKDTAFTYPSGRNYSRRDLVDILQRCHNAAGIKYTGLGDFIKKMRV